MNIIFKNKPKLSEHEVDQKFNKRRLELIPHVEKFIQHHELFQDKNVLIQFVEKGVSSLVSVIETEDEKFILKIPLSLHYSEGEPEFLKVWEKAGIKVPHVIENGKIGEHLYLLMEYIDAPILEFAYTNNEMNETGVYLKMGQTLRLMHGPKAKGFGKLVDGKAEFENFNEWVHSPDMDKRVQYIKENNIIDEPEVLMARISDILTGALQAVGESNYCHNDFGVHNIFATDPLTVFDPSPRFNNFYVDLGRSAQSMIAKGQTLSLEQFIKGYFNGESYNNIVLTASIIFNILYKIPYVHQTKRLKNIENYKKYIKENKNLLEN